MSQEKYGLPPQLFTATPDSRSAQSRIAVDIGGTGFFEGRNFRISYELDIANGTSNWLRFSSPIDFIIKLQAVSIDSGALHFKAYRDGTDNGGWVPVDVFGMNITTEAAAHGYARQATVEDTGTFTPSGVTTENIRLRTSGATAQATTVSASVGGERGLLAGTYFLQFENIAGSGATKGVYDLQWEERPADLNQWLVEL